MLQIVTCKQSTSSSDEDRQYCIQNVVIYIKSDSIVRQMNKVHLLSYTMMNNKHIFYIKDYVEYVTCDFPCDFVGVVFDVASFFIPFVTPRGSALFYKDRTV